MVETKPLQDLAFQVLDCNADAGTLLVGLATLPRWWNALWVLTLLASAAQVIMLYAQARPMLNAVWRPGTNCPEAVELFWKRIGGDAGAAAQARVALFEHGLQVVLSLYAFRVVPPRNEYQIYSFANAVVALLLLAKKNMDVLPARESSGLDQTLLMPPSGDVVPEEPMTEQALLMPPRMEVMPEKHQVLACPE